MKKLIANINITMDERNYILHSTSNDNAVLHYISPIDDKPSICCDVFIKENNYVEFKFRYLTKKCVILTTDNIGCFFDFNHFHKFEVDFWNLAKTLYNFEHEDEENSISKERFEVFGNIIKDNEQMPNLLDNHQATVRLNEFDKRIVELEKQLADVKNSCDYYMKRSNDLVLKLAEKDKLINEYADEHAMLQYKIADLAVKEIKAEDFAIEQLEKVKKYVDDLDTPCVESICNEYMCGIEDYIDKQIKELKGD